ncbi:endolytic transglycosylase MltG, partial [Arthrobacter sp. I3]|uniref:endolytic transglycosylase MltG n=1 Tax=Arthrobacter sp. I3 TaxID=218158 RepID=UPI0005BE9847
SHDAAAHDAGVHDGYAPHPHDEAHHLYDNSGDPQAQPHPEAEYHGDPGEELMAGAARYDKGPSKKVRRRRRFLALVLTLTVFVVAIAVGAQFLKPLLGGDTMADYPGPGTGEVTITIEPGAGTRSVATELQSKKVVANADTFLKEFTASGGALNPGTFSMRQEMKNSDAVDVLLNKGQSKVMYFALSAGLRISESLQAISEGTGIPVQDLKALSDAPAQFGVPAKAKNLEGYLAPGEYRFPLGSSAKDILQKLVGSTQDELKAQGVTDPAKQYDVVTVASIVQAEGGQAEYGDVAGAIYNRLKPNNTETNGLIQSDATVTYGLGIRSFHIDEAQKADKSNPYNTYANQGLPAGPIGSPGKTAIDAAAKPKSNSFLYWVTINLDTKETKFSKTLAEHNGYVAQYNAWCEANPGRCV